MHFEILIEDESGQIALTSIVEKILGPNGQDHSYRIIAYKGIGRLPKNLREKTDRRKRQLLNLLPSLLRGYGRSQQSFPAAVIVVVDLDQRDCMEFKQELLGVLNNCDPAPTTLFRIAIEEGEAWLLGDKNAILAAYPKAKTRILDNYVQDAICETWEVLADAIYTGGSTALKPKGYPIIGREKCEWAGKISPHMDVDKNKSPSFGVFRDGLRNLLALNFLVFHNL